MKNFVKLIQQVHAERFSVVMNKITAQKIPVAFLSTAPMDQAIETAKNFRDQGINIATLLVNNAMPPPSQLSELNIVHLSDAAQIYPQPEYILANSHIDTRVALKIFPVDKVVNLYRGKKGALAVSEHIYETFMAHLSELKEVYESLIDEESKKTFRGYWLGNISNRLGEIVYSNSSHYLISGFIPERGAIVIDCGVYDGTTATIFSEMGYRVYGFEMDKENYDVAKKIAEEKNFILENLGLGSRKQESRYDSYGSGSKLVVNGSKTATITTLDAYVREKNLPRVDFIKMDVEGAELDVLKGAVTTIARFKPILALSAYHKLDDFWTLMNFVKSIRPDYEFAMRQSYESPEDITIKFEKNFVEYLDSLGLEIDTRDYWECVLFAR